MSTTHNHRLSQSLILRSSKSLSNEKVCRVLYYTVRLCRVEALVFSLSSQPKQEMAQECQIHFLGSRDNSMLHIEEGLVLKCHTCDVRDGSWSQPASAPLEGDKQLRVVAKDQSLPSLPQQSRYLAICHKHLLILSDHHPSCSEVPEVAGNKLSDICLEALAGMNFNATWR